MWLAQYGNTKLTKFDRMVQNKKLSFDSFGHLHIWQMWMSILINQSASNQRGNLSFRYLRLILSWLTSCKAFFLQIMFKDYKQAVNEDSLDVPRNKIHCTNWHPKRFSSLKNYHIREHPTGLAKITLPVVHSSQLHLPAFSGQWSSIPTSTLNQY